MPPIEVLLPIVLLVLAFLLKLFIDRSVDLPLFIQSVMELPVDIAFLASSFVIAYTIAFTTQHNDGILYFLIYVIGSIIVILGWRRAERFLDDSKYFSAVLLVVICYGLAISGIVISIKLLIGSQS